MCFSWHVQGSSESMFPPISFILCYAFSYSSMFLILPLSHYSDIYHVNIVSAQAIQNFLCANCQYKRHQCFACGKLGSSDKSTGAEVLLNLQPIYI